MGQCSLGTVDLGQSRESLVTVQRSVAFLLILLRFLNGKYLCFLVTRVSERNTIDPEHVMLALTRLRVFMVERGIMEVSMTVYDPNRGKLSPRELYAILHVVFAETEIMMHIHKKNYLSIA